MSAWPWLDRWVDAATADPENQHIGRSTHFVLVAECPGAPTVIVRYDAGTVACATAATVEAAADPGVDVIHLRATESVWRELADPAAAPRRHDLLSLTKVDDGIDVVSGWLAMVRHLRVLSRLVEIGKSHGLA